MSWLFLSTVTIIAGIIIRMFTWCGVCDTVTNMAAVVRNGMVGAVHSIPVDV